MPRRKTDLEIRDQVICELWRETPALPPGISVEFYAGIATLSGAVDSWAEKFAAREAAHRVGAVYEVINNLIVEPAAVRFTDSEVSGSVKRALEREVHVPAGRIRFAVSRGVVTLEGDVDSTSQITDAERAVRNLAGVGRVVNLLKAEKATMAQQVHRAFERALQQQATRVPRAPEQAEAPRGREA